MKIDTQEVKKLFGKYENDGLDIFIEFSRLGIRLRVSNGMFHLSKILTHDMLDDLPGAITFEFIVCELVKEFEYKLQKIRNESEDLSCDDIAKNGLCKLCDDRDQCAADIEELNLEIVDEGDRHDRQAMR